MLQYDLRFLQHEAKISGSVMEESTVMTLKDLSKEIVKACTECKQCDHSCTGYILKKCVENRRFVMPIDEQILLSN